MARKESEFVILQRVEEKDGKFYCLHELKAHCSFFRKTGVCMLEFIGFATIKNCECDTCVNLASRSVDTKTKKKTLMYQPEHDAPFYKINGGTGLFVFHDNFLNEIIDDCDTVEQLFDIYE